MATTPDDDECAIVVEGLRRRYGDVEAVAGIDFSVRTGEIFALLGPNGAGKTTTVEILEGFRRPTAGRVRVLGVDPARAGRDFRERVGVVLQTGALDDALSVEETLRHYAACYAAPLPWRELLDMVALVSRRRARVRDLSGGQRRRLELALALVGDPELVFLDEPTTGLDPHARRAAWEMIAALREDGRTILLTSHYMDEVERLADRATVLRSGRLVAEGSPAQLRARGLRTEIRFRLPDGAPLPAGLAALADTQPDGTTSILTRTPTEVMARLGAWAMGHGGELARLSVTPPSLEDVYLELTEPGGRADAR
ncbi:MAG TPA: ABC transporter ATP-binding protein [Solirubrobacteraceae bacterium]|jgi:ABC-2 type transport system ATP-binding protein|nr:ABC transporter ATP-binding protein [Solirubrobacteraceae bacterium]